MPTELEKARCDGFLKLVYYVPRRNEAVQNRLIFRIKERISRRATDFLASELLPAIQAVLSERGVTPNDAVFTYLPRARRARLAHGTDQARELARALAKRSEIPCLPLILRHARANKRQKMLSPTKRLENAKASYFPNEGYGCKGKTVLLVDDLVTTGAGMAVATRILRRMGAVNVIGVAVGSDAVNKDPERR